MEAGSRYLTSVTYLPNGFEVDLTDNANCNNALSGQYSCCTANLKKIEFVINPNCRNAIASVNGTTLMPSYDIQTWPGTTPPGYPAAGELVAKVTGLANVGQSMKVIITLKPENPVQPGCSTPEQFLLNGKFWFASYGDAQTGKIDACCTTDTLL